MADTLNNNRINADINVNVIAHLGYFRNIDLPTRGIYYVEISLFYGGGGSEVSVGGGGATKIAPIGLFSAPESFDSFVKTQKIFPAPVFLDASEILDRARIFRTRHIVIRYLDEVHELNDGVHWRLTVPNVSVDEEGSGRAGNGSGQPPPPRCPDVLRFKFDLFCCPLLRDEGLDMMYEVERLIPRDPVFERVATQSVEVHGGASGVHAYYPIRFDKSHFVELDAMFHVCVTAVNFDRLTERLLLGGPSPQLDHMHSSNPPPHNVVVEVPLDDYARDPAQNVNRSLFSDYVDHGSDEEDEILSLSQVQGEHGAAADGEEEHEAYRYDPNITSPVREGEDEDDEEDPYRLEEEEEEERRDEGSTGGMSRSSSRPARPETRLSHTPPRKSPVPQRARESTGTATDSTGVSSAGRVDDYARELYETDATYQLHGQQPSVSSPAGGVPAAGTPNMARDHTPPRKPLVSPTRATLNYEEEDDEDDPYREDPYVLDPDTSPARDYLGGRAAEGATRHSHPHPNNTSMPTQTRQLHDSSSNGVVNISSSTASAASFLSRRLATMSPEFRAATTRVAASSVSSSSARSTPDTTPTSTQRKALALGSLGRSLSKVNAAMTRVLHGDDLDLGGDLSARMLSSIEPPPPPLQPPDEQQRPQQDEERPRDGHSNGQELFLSTASSVELERAVRVVSATLLANWAAVCEGLARADLDGLLDRTRDGDVDCALRQDTACILADMQQTTNAGDGDNGGVGGGISSSSSHAATVQAVRILVENANGKCLSTWMMLFAGLRKVSRQLIHKLRPLYSAQSRVFWKSQMLMHTCCTTDLSLEEEDTRDLETLKSLIKAEEGGGGPAAAAATLTLTGSAHGREGGRVFRSAVARGLPVYDPQVHRDLARLPVMVLQQYVEPNLTYDDVALSSDDEASFLDSLYDDSVLAPNSVLRTDSADYAEMQASLGTAPTPAPGGTHTPPAESAGSGLSVPVLRARSSKDWYRQEKADEKVPHLIVLQHGYMGSAADMRLVKNTLAALLLDPAFRDDNIQILCPVSNDFSVPAISEENSKFGIEAMGSKLADEINRYVQDSMPELIWSTYTGVQVGKISFICHSIGGLVVRKCLEDPIIRPLLPLMYTYISLATPHLGTLFPESQVVSTGLWALAAMKSCQVLRELVLGDMRGPADLDNCLLHSLANNNALVHFSRAVVLVSAVKDYYVPYYSTRVEVSARARTDVKVGPTIVKMAADLLSQFDPSKLVRIAIDNNEDSGRAASRLDSLTGRHVHISYLDNPILMEQLLCSLQSYLLPVKAPSAEYD